MLNAWFYTYISYYFSENRQNLKVIVELWTFLMTNIFFKRIFTPLKYTSILLKNSMLCHFLPMKKYKLSLWIINNCIFSVELYFYGTLLIKKNFIFFNYKHRTGGRQGQITVSKLDINWQWKSNKFIIKFVTLDWLTQNILHLEGNLRRSEGTKKDSDWTNQEWIENLLE